MQTYCQQNTSSGWGRGGILKRSMAAAKKALFLIFLPFQCTAAASQSSPSCVALSRPVAVAVGTVAVAAGTVAVAVGTVAVAASLRRGGTILTFLGKCLLFISDRMVLNVV